MLVKFFNIANNLAVGALSDVLHAVNHMEFEALLVNFLIAKC